MLPPILTKLTALVGKARRAERRRTRRIAPPQVTPCQIRTPGDPEAREAWVHNLSPYGAGVVARQDLPPGTDVALLLVNAPHTFSLSVGMTVVRSHRVARGDYFLGGQFTRPLRHDELLPFLL